MKLDPRREGLFEAEGVELRWFRPVFDVFEFIKRLEVYLGFVYFLSFEIAIL